MISRVEILAFRRKEIAIGISGGWYLADLDLDTINIEETSP